MNDIDEPFRLTWDFCIAWALLNIPSAAVVLRLEFDFGPLYAEIGLTLAMSLFATFLLYGPILLVKKAISSGARGWMALKAFILIILTAVILFGSLLISGFYTAERARVLAFLFCGFGTAFAGWVMYRVPKSKE